jgi:thiol-disulfide isomerase/thioredoxin
MGSRSRRDVLAGGGASLTAAISGCLGRITGGGSTPDMTVQGVAVRTSPGEELPVLPSGRIVLLDFWATWCAPCKPQMAELRSIREQFPDVHMLSITNETDVEAITSFWREYEGTWPVAMDPELETNDQFGVNRIPTLLLFGADGEQVWKHVGLAAADSIAEKLREAGA